MFVEAVHRYYESRRRIYNDSQPSRSTSAKKVKKTARKKEMRKRVGITVNIFFVMFHATPCD